MIKWLPILLIFLTISCSGNNPDVIKKYDQVYGCDNPHRELTDMEYKICIDKQRAAGSKPIDIEKLGTNLKDLIGANQGIVYQNTVNKQLWDAAIKTTQKYPLKLADNQGGFIETDWIYDANEINQRCAIKIQILSTELVSNGVQSFFNCQNQIGDVWINDSKDYQNEEKLLTLKILEEAQNLKNSL